MIIILKMRKKYFKHVIADVITKGIFISLLYLLSFPSGLSAQRLVLNGAYINVNGGSGSTTPVYLVVDQSNTNGITRIAGHIFTPYQYGFLKWNTGTNTGNYVLPFGVAGTAADYIPFSFNKISSGNSDIFASTWGTNQANLPYPGVSSVSAVTSMNGIGNGTTTAIDRFWDVRTTDATTADITFSYRASENTTSSQTDIFKVQRWQGLICTPWSSPLGTGNAGVNSGIGTLGPLVAETFFAPYVLVREAAPLEHNGPAVSAGSNVTICSGSSATIGGSPSASGGTGTYTYAWIPTTALSSATIANPVANPTVSTTYTLTVISGGCSNTATVLVVVAPSPTITVCSSSIVSSLPAGASATGGTITTSGEYTIHTFTSDGIFTPNGNLNVEYLVVAGGGGGGKDGQSGNPSGGGGGAGGLLTGTTTVSATSYPISVGTGGAGSLVPGTIGANGGNSIFSTVTATGGGGGGVSWEYAGAGGSGGGASYGEDPYYFYGGAASPAGQGNKGGDGVALNFAGAGGGGAGAAGNNPGGSGAAGTGGNGGSGLASLISGSPVMYAAGGGGGAYGAHTSGSGGSGIGGNGGANGSNGTNAAVNTGSGGGGGGSTYLGPENPANSGNGGNGSSGIVIIKYLTPSVNGICSGSITVCGASTYAWAPPEGLDITTGDHVVATPGTITTYTVTGTAQGCSSKKTITVIPSPTIGITPSAPAVCNGGSATLTASGASTYVWTPAASLNVSTGATVTATPLTTTTYSVTGTANGCSNTGSVIVMINSPVITTTPSGAANICNGGSTNITADGAATYSWSPSAGLNTTTGAVVAASPTVTTTYTVIGTANGCSSAAYITVSVGSPCALSPCLVLDGGYISIHGGTSTDPVFMVIDDDNASGIKRLPSGGHIYTQGQYNFVKWNAGAGTGNYVFPFGVGVTASDYIPFTFNKTTTGISDITASTWSVTPQNMPHPGMSTVPACYVMKGTGDSLSTALDRFWDIRTSAPATADISFSYRGSENTTSIPGDLLKVQRWTGLASSPWSAPLGTGNAGVTSGVGTLSPVTGQTDFAPFVLVRSSAPLQQGPGVSAGSNVTICSGSSTSLIGSVTNPGGLETFTYSWAPAASLSSSVISNPVASPTATTTYSLTVASAGFSNTATVVVTVNPTPTTTVGSSSSTICIGGSANLTAGGATSYVWSPSSGLNSTTGAVVVANPSITTTYTVIGTTNGCSNSAYVLVTVGTCSVIPCLVLDGGFIDISGGTSVNPVFLVVDDPSTSGITRLASGGHIYTEGQYDFVKWNSGTSTGNYVFPFGVGVTASDYIPFTFTKSASGSADITASTWSVTPQNMPHPGVSTVPLCHVMKGVGDSLTTVLDRFWDIRTSAPTIADITFSYRGSENTPANPTDQLSAQRWIGSGCSLWSPPLGTGTAGVQTGIGAVTLIAQNAFSPFVLMHSTLPLQHAPIANGGLDKTVYVAGNTQIGGSPAVTGGVAPFTYSWIPAISLDNANAANPIASPTTATNYTLTVTDAGGCSSTDDVSVQVSLEVVISPANPSICAGDYIQLTASGAATYNWSPSESLSSNAVAAPIASPTATTTYTLVTTNNGYTGITWVTVVVSSTPDLEVIGDQRICQGGCAHLHAEGTGSFLWTPSTGLSDNNIANPSATVTETTTYTVKLTSGTCSTEKTVTVFVDQMPVIQLSPDVTICQGTSAHLNAIADAAQFQWSPASGLDNPQSPFPIASPLTTTNYAVTAINGACSAQESVLVTVKPAPTAIYSFTYPGMQVQFSTTNTVAANYFWTFGDGGTSNVSSPTHTYAQAGTYNVCLSVNNECGSNRYCENIVVGPVTVNCCH